MIAGEGSADRRRRRRRLGPRALLPLTASSSRRRGSRTRLRSSGIASCRLAVIVRPIESSERRRRNLPLRLSGRHGRVHGATGSDRDRLVGDRTGQRLRAGPDRRRRLLCRRDRAQPTSTSPTGEGGIRKRLREQIRRNERNGWSVELSPPGRACRAGDAPPSSGPTRRRWRAHRRLGRYLYPSAYFETLLRSERSWLLVAAREGTPLAGAIAVASDGYLHYYLGGTADEALADSPMKNLFAAMISLGGRARHSGQPRRRRSRQGTRSTSSSGASPTAMLRSEPTR